MAVRSPSLARAHEIARKGHRASHGHLLSPVPAAGPGQRGRLDAIVVPTSRPPDPTRSGIVLALSIARRYDCPVVFLCSRNAGRGEHLADLVRTAGVRILVLGSDVLSMVPPFTVDALAVSTRWARGSDTGAKRNVGLVLARHFGWRNVLFLDDDVDTPEDGDDPCLPRLDDALLAMSTDLGPEAVGWTTTATAVKGGSSTHGFLDNSVVCHARRAVGEPQACFVGGGALLVDCAAWALPFFPRIYNEDWIYLLGLLWGRAEGSRVVGNAGLILQDPFDPFRHRRAALEEPGDILAEGLFPLLTESCDVREAGARDPEYWKEVLEQRFAMVDRLRRGLDDMSQTEAGQVRGRRIRQTLAGTLRVHAEMGADLDGWSRAFAAFLPTWHADRHAWSGVLEQVRPGSIPEALNPYGGWQLRHVLLRSARSSPRAVPRISPTPSRRAATKTSTRTAGSIADAPPVQPDREVLVPS